MEAQLRLLSAPEPIEQAPHDQPADDEPALEAGPVAWRLSSSTRELGRRGVEHARAALQSARSANASGADTPTDRTGDHVGHRHSSAA
jgi:hypothetical protein